jgi:hypothetical protein
MRDLLVKLSGASAASLMMQRIPKQTPNDLISTLCLSSDSIGFDNMEIILNFWED